MCLRILPGQQTNNEKRKLEQLRALDNNLDIHVLKIDECCSALIPRDQISLRLLTNETGAKDLT